MIDATEVVTTSDSKEVLEAICAVLQEERLAACMKTTGPVSSTYFWREAWEESLEYVLVATTLPEFVPQVRRVMREKHNYETPEIVARTVAVVDDEYAEWLLRSLHPAVGRSDASD